MGWPWPQAFETNPLSRRRRYQDNFLIDHKGCDMKTTGRHVTGPLHGSSLRLSLLARKRAATMIASLLCGSLALKSGMAHAQVLSAPPSWCNNVFEVTPPATDAGSPANVCYAPPATNSKSGAYIVLINPLTITTAGGLASGKNYFTDENWPNGNSASPAGIAIVANATPGTSQINIEGDQTLDLHYVPKGVNVKSNNASIATGIKSIADFLPTSTTDITLSAKNATAIFGLYVGGRYTTGAGADDYHMNEIKLDGKVAIHLNGALFMWGADASSDSWLHGSGSLSVDSQGIGYELRTAAPTPGLWWSTGIISEASGDIDLTGKVDLNASVGVNVLDTSGNVAIGGAERGAITSTGLDGAGIEVFLQDASNTRSARFTNLQVTTLEDGAPGVAVYGGKTYLNDVSIKTEGGKTSNANQGYSYADSYGLLIRGDALALPPEVMVPPPSV